MELSKEMVKLGEGYQKVKNWRKKNPEKLKAQSRRYREKHHEECKARGRNYHKSHREEEKIFSKKWYLENKEKKDAYHRDWKKKNPEKVKLYQKHSLIKAKNLLFELLGHKCSNPFNKNHGDFLTDPRCLQIDHVHGNGVQERKKRKHSSGYYRGILKEVRAGSKDYQLLCANCNWIKRVENKEV